MAWCAVKGSHNRKAMLSVIETILEQPFKEKLIFTSTLWLCSIPWLRRYFMNLFLEKMNNAKV